MKAEIYWLYPELLFPPNTEETLRQLIDVAKEALHEIEDRILYNLSVTMHHRIQAVKDAEWRYTKY
jgi:hypothetical protein